MLSFILMVVGARFLIFSCPARQLQVGGRDPGPNEPWQNALGKVTGHQSGERMGCIPLTCTLT